MPNLPSINPEVTVFTLWRWRTDVKRWIKVSTKPTLDQARVRQDEERMSPRYRTPPHLRITKDVTTRTGVDA